MAVLGLNHIALDVSAAASRLGGLPGYLRELNRESEVVFQKSVRLVRSPYQQLIGPGGLGFGLVRAGAGPCATAAESHQPNPTLPEVWEVCFIADPDGASIELLAHNGTLTSLVADDW